MKGKKYISGETIGVDGGNLVKGVPQQSGNNTRSVDNHDTK
jgi:hypothetical protein